MAPHITKLGVRRGANDPGDVLRLVFRPTRTRRRQVVVGGAPSLASLLPVDDLAHDLVFAVPPPPDSTLEVQVTYEGEPVSLSSATWYDTAGHDQAPAPPTSESWSKARATELRRVTGLDPEEDGPFGREEIEKLRLLSAMSDPLAVAFFTQVDRATSPALMDPSEPWYQQRVADVDALTKALVPRLRDRITALQQGLQQSGVPGVPDENMLQAPPTDAVHRIAEVLTGIMEDFYPGGYEGLDVGALGLAYEGFATGTLGPCTMSTPTRYEAQPDSSFMFCWAEFAFLCRQVGEQTPALWDRLIRIFTCAEMLFIEAYCERGTGCTPSGPPCLPDWSTRGPPVQPETHAPALLDTYWRQLVRDLHFSSTAHLSLLHAQHLTRGCAAGIP